jgi:membrane protease YdiL (CAAX protease family)
VFLLVPRTTAGVLVGMVCGSLLFGATHLRNGRTGMAYATGFGVMFSILYIITDNLIAVIVAHAAGNVLTVAQWAPRIEQARRAAAPHAATLPQ